MSPTLALATVAGLTASGWPLALLACHLDPGPLASRTRKAPHVKALAAADERHPDYCHTCKGFCGSKAHR